MNNIKSFYLNLLKIFKKRSLKQSPDRRDIPLKGTYSNFKMYDRSGKRLAIFVEKNEDGLLFTVYKCSRQDNFNKREIKDAHAVKSTYYHPIVWSENVEFTRNNVEKILSDKFYKFNGVVCTPTHTSYGKIAYDENGRPLFSNGRPVLMNFRFKKIKEGDVI